jgi:hypothetical protein
VVSYKNFLDCRRIWLTLDGEERNVAQRSLQFVSDSMEVALMKLVITRHSHFTNSSMINRAQQRCQNMDKEGVPSSSGIDIKLLMKNGIR